LKTESAIVIQARVLFALVMREMSTRFGRSAGGYLWAVLEPVAAVLMLTAIFSQISRHPPLGGDFALFFATGYMAFHIYKDISDYVSNAISANKALLNFPRITIVDTILARFILQFFTSVFVAVVVLSTVHLNAGEHGLIRFASVFTSVGLAAVLGVGVGALNCLLFPYSPTWQRVFNLLNRPLFIISGVFFLFDDMPLWIQDILWWNPLVHIVAKMREGFYPMYSPDYVSEPYVLAVGFGFLVFAVLLLRKLQGAILER
jgi:capsular polysaccharide transport system permease protein